MSQLVLHGLLASILLCGCAEPADTVYYPADDVVETPETETALQEAALPDRDGSNSAETDRDPD